MVNYDKSSIYKLCSKDLNVKEIYVGSTVNFTRRKCHHKYSCNNPDSPIHHFKVYEYIRNNGGFENWDMIEVEAYCAADKKDLHKRERYWIENLESRLNCKIPGRTIKEYRDDNKEEIAQKCKEYYIINKEVICERSKEYSVNNKEKIAVYNKEYSVNNKEKIAVYKKEYSVNNKEKIDLYHKEYSINNKEKISVYSKERYINNKEMIKCVCGALMNRSSLKRHLTRKTHQIAMNTLETQTEL